MAADSDGSVVLRQLVEELSLQLRAGLDRLGDLPQETGERLARELGLVTREEWDALELRLAQVEHRLRLLEHGSR
jgi:BMFP domain-containing protein YqiC